MSESISAVYDALASEQFTVKGRNVTTYNIHETPNDVPAANLPARILSLFNPRGERSGASGILFSGQRTEVDWVAIDFFLWRPIGSDTGTHAHEAEVLDYCTQYIEMLRGWSVGRLLAPEVRPEVINYPFGSGNWFYGVRAVLPVKLKWSPT